MNTTSTYICSQHFKASDFLKNNNNNTLGKKTSKIHNFSIQKDKLNMGCLVKCL